MAESSIETKKKLLESAKKEFLEKGFIGASLRTIAANAGVTTGAMYRHFKDKDAFFCALVDEAIEVTKKVVMLADSKNHENLTPKKMSEHISFEKKSTEKFLDYMYENFDAFTLLLTKSSGSTHERFQEDICELYTENCKKTFDLMYEQKIASKHVSPMTIHFMASTVINAFCDIILHNIPKKDAGEYIADIMEFTSSGMYVLLGIEMP
ncbi:MAG: TetR/AcrR family transcriptional regulator [Treponema sp.]|nr:TetR/AcrR family transcriptional regulator [Treponema sp.]